MTFLRPLLGAAMLAALLGSPVAAHSVLTEADPAAGATLAAVPAVTLTFGESVGLDFASLTLEAQDGSKIELGDLQAAKDGHALVAPVPDDLAAGTYTVRWSVLSRDGHPVQGDYTFTLAP